MTPLRIVQLVPSLEIGGAERFAAWLAEAQLAAGHDVHLVCVTRGGVLERDLPPSLRGRVRIVGKRGRFDATVLRRLRSVLRELRPHVLHTHLFTALSWGAVAARLAGVPVVVHTQHAVHADDQRYLPVVRRALAPLLHAIVGCGPAVLEDVERRGYGRGTRRLCIENGIPLAGRPVASLDGAPLRVGAVGRLVPIKGHRYLLDAVARLRAQGVDVHLTLVGDGPSRPDLEELTYVLGLTDRVTFTGAVADVPQRLAGFDLFVLPSLSEAMPMALLEAAAAGLPLVVTDAGGAPTLLRAGAGGRVVPPADGPALAAAIAEVAALPLEERRALGEASRATALARYDITGVAERYVGLYRELLAARAASRP